MNVYVTDFIPESGVALVPSLFFVEELFVVIGIKIMSKANPPF